MKTIMVVDATPAILSLVTDIRMPGMNGFELAQAVRVARPDLPILFIIGSFEPTQGIHLEWMRQPNVGFLPKPFLPAHLLYELGILLAA